MQDKPYKVVNVQERDKWQSSYGEFQNYALQLEGEEGWVQISQKPETPAPQAGQELFGRIEVQTRGDKTWRKFKKGQRQDGGYSGSTGSGSSKADTEYIIMMLEELTGRREKPENPTSRSSGDTTPTVEELDQPVDLSDIPF